MNVADVIRSRVQIFAISEETSVHETARYLRERQVRAVGVLDGAGKLVGVVSQSDISDKVAAENKSAGISVSAITTRELVTVSSDSNQASVDASSFASPLMGRTHENSEGLPA